jgi:uncharacterized cupredoxin-like copper-binding protein
MLETVVSKPVLAFLALGIALSLVGCASSPAAPGFTYAPAAPLASTPPASAASIPSPSATAAASETAASAAVPSASGSGQTAIELSEWKVAMPTTIKAGMVTFTITNIGAVQHELIGFRSPLDPVAYPRTKTGDVNEEGKGITSATDGPNLDPAGTETRTIDLTVPGRYVFMCNIPGHFVQGMYAVVTVTP